MKSLYNIFLKKTLTVVIITASIFLSGCGGNQREHDIESLSEKYSVPEEKQLTVYTSHKEEVYLPVITEFENTTGIWVNIVAGGTSEMFDLIESGEGSDCDIMFGGGAEYYEAKKELFAPFKVAESDILDSQYLSSEDLWTPFTELPIVFIYNPKLVEKKDAPGSWRDLFDERFKGQIAFADMEISGTSYTIVSLMSQLFNETPEKIIQELYEQLDGNVLDSSGLVIPYVESGRCMVGITLEETAKKYMANGYEITMTYPEEGTTALPDACAIVKDAPHSYNAGKFLDFIIAYDTQKYAAEHFHRRSVRKDVELSKDYEEVKLLDFDIKKSAADENRAMDAWRAVRASGREHP
ncbi:extracellular solute-binding protein [Oribacterium sp. FC2011]|uniref:extracellular solute-binding protein n=1 Tax=Oribacterium sp. FC2011 TaxID=1408311 RepID=UPI0005D20E17|nr:extracellular solute-binding protein [Oribacterium sp. FC2011]